MHVCYISKTGKGGAVANILIWAVTRTFFPTKIHKKTFGNFKKKLEIVLPVYP